MGHWTFAVFRFALQDFIKKFFVLTSPCRIFVFNLSNNNNRRIFNKINLIAPEGAENKQLLI